MSKKLKFEASKLYFKVIRNNKPHEICFEDMTALEQRDLLDRTERHQLEEIIIHLANTLYQYAQSMELNELLNNDEE